jgi:asparagine synthase (glutamine-hydrolysing)
MCGIAGLIPQKTRSINSDQVRSFLRQLEHRGPDDSGVLCLRGRRIHVTRTISQHVVADALIMHRRLSILDLTEAGWQPMGTKDQGCFIVFNGEIYNYVELREQLEALGQCFRSRSDTEVLLGAYECWN